MMGLGSGSSRSREVLSFLFRFGVWLFLLECDIKLDRVFWW